MSTPPGKLSYCIECKKLTETVLIKSSGIFGLLGEKRRICRDCARPKAFSEIEMEKRGKYG